MKIQKPTVRQALLKIKEQKGVLTKQNVVDAARSPSNILHHHFEWDDSKAGELYRLEQAGRLIRSVKLIFEEIPETQIITSAFVSLPSARRRRTGYNTLEEVMADKKKREERVLMCVKELEVLKRRYEDLTELNSVWNLIADIVTRVLGGKGKRKTS